MKHTKGMYANAMYVRARKSPRIETLANAFNIEDPIVRARKSPRIETTVSATTAPFKSSGLVRARGLKHNNGIGYTGCCVRARKSPRIETLRIVHLALEDPVRARKSPRIETRISCSQLKMKYVRARKSPRIETTLGLEAIRTKLSGLVRARGLKLARGSSTAPDVCQGS